MNWYRDVASGRFVCVLCEQRAVRDAGKPVGVRVFASESAEELRDHLWGHRDHPERLHGDFMPPTQAPLDVVDGLELAQLELLAIEAMSYDGSCEGIAEQFLNDYPKASLYDRARLARHVQQSIEEWLEAEMKDGGGA